MKKSKTLLSKYILFFFIILIAIILNLLDFSLVSYLFLSSCFMLFLFYNKRLFKVNLFFLLYLIYELINCNSVTTTVFSIRDLNNNTLNLITYMSKNKEALKHFWDTNHCDAQFTDLNRYNPNRALEVFEGILHNIRVTGSSADLHKWFSNTDYGQENADKIAEILQTALNPSEPNNFASIHRQLSGNIFHSPALNNAVNNAVNNTANQVHNNHALNTSPSNTRLVNDAIESFNEAIDSFNIKVNDWMINELNNNNNLGDSIQNQSVNTFYVVTGAVLLIVMGITTIWYINKKDKKGTKDSKNDDHHDNDNHHDNGSNGDTSIEPKDSYEQLADIAEEIIKNLPMCIGGLLMYNNKKIYSVFVRGCFIILLIINIKNVSLLFLNNNSLLFSFKKDIKTKLYI